MPDVHSKIVGGSTAERVINCPGSVKLVAAAPAPLPSPYADEGTLLHSVIDDILSARVNEGKDAIGRKYGTAVFTQELLDEKIRPALKLLDEVDPDYAMTMMNEALVGFGDELPGVFGTCDVLGRLDGRAIMLDWKFGDGVIVSAEENYQLMFYAAGAMRTEETAHLFKGVTEVELVIIQPPEIRRWTTTVERIEQFMRQLVDAVRQSEKPDAPVVPGKWCRFCPAKLNCPAMNGAIERAQRAELDKFDVQKVNDAMAIADQLELWIADVREAAFRLAESGKRLADYKLVAKQGRRQWVNQTAASAALAALGLTQDEIAPREMISPAQAEKALKSKKLTLPDDLAVSVSSGSTLVPRSDKRAELLQIGQQLTAALSKLS